ncbi:hypothetical protein [Desulforegula conservatrix]|uniref:hypothetical protein n=1 Tax=Desulforegula conservatrix TaxID=153026 RepID=UPI0004293423|nr:hypothetical protein [Desulforegula conservatrix]
MDLEELKTRFKSKMRADLKDIDIVLKATPFLCREVCRIEEELANAEKRIQFLSEQLSKRMPPLQKEGERKGCKWKSEVDGKHNLLMVHMSGEFDYRTAKIATNQMLETIPHLQPECCILFDVCGISPGSDKKLIFHLRKTMHHLRQIGVKRIIYIPNPEMSALGYVFEEYSEKDGFKVHKSSSVSEARDALINMDRFLKA